MPELPEVETIRTQLERLCPFEVKEFTHSPFFSDLVKEHEFSPSGLTLERPTRKGKVLCLHFGEDKVMISHLGMSGSWIVSERPVTEKHTHFQFHGRSQGKALFLAYVDPRRFGFAYFVSTTRAQQILQKLGVDFASEEFTGDYIYQTVKSYPKRKIKVHLLDQHLFAGIGNYLANELCAHARIRPTKSCGKLTRTQCEQLAQARGPVLNLALQSGGTTFAGGYRDTTGEKGQGLTHLVVFYQKICGLCQKTPVKKLILSGRGTYYCPFCQH